MTLLQRTEELLKELLEIEKIPNLTERRNKLEVFIFENFLPFCDENFKEMNISEIENQLTSAYRAEREAFLAFDSENNLRLYNQKKAAILKILLIAKGKAKERERKALEEPSIKPRGTERVVSIITVDKKEIPQKIDDYLKKSKQAYEKAQADFKKEDWDNAVEESIDSIEFSLKALLISTTGKYPKTHDFQDKNTKQLYKEAKATLEKQDKLKEFHNLGRLFFLPNFWGDSYECSKYGGDYGGSKHLYGKQEAELGLYHAKEELTCSGLAYTDYQLRKNINPNMGG